MSWIILEGLDRTGKSTVAEIYKKKGYEVVHMSAPDKRYRQPGYTGPSYLDDMLEMYMDLDGKNVLFDRSIYGEFIWPYIYNRDPHLTLDDLEILKEYEGRNMCQRILMVDPNTEAHWKRCVDNKEPLDKRQFILAGRLFDKLAHNHDFIPRQLSDFEDATEKQSEDDTLVKEGPEQEPLSSREITADVRNSEGTTIVEAGEEKTKEQIILEKANAINSVLSKRIVKQKGRIFDLIEADIKKHLNNQLKNLFGGADSSESFSKEEILVLKMYANKILEKQKERV